jgi:hypothetical protein
MSAVTTRKFAKATLVCLGFDILPLRMGIGHRDDLRMRELPRHEQRQRAPAAAEFEDRLPVGEIGMVFGLAQRLFFGLLQGGCLAHVEQAGIFAVRPEHFRKE